MERRTCMSGMSRNTLERAHWPELTSNLPWSTARCFCDSSVGDMMERILLCVSETNGIVTWRWAPSLRQWHSGFGYWCTRLVWLSKVEQTIVELQRRGTGPPLPVWSLLGSTRALTTVDQRLTTVDSTMFAWIISRCRVPRSRLHAPNCTPLSLHATKANMPGLTPLTAHKATREKLGKGKWARTFRLFLELICNPAKT